MAEWLKAHDSKSCDGVNPFGGSNPLSSAILTASCRFFVLARRLDALRTKKTAIYSLKPLRWMRILSLPPFNIGINGKDPVRGLLVSLRLSIPRG